jgi:hypothetical protein
MLSVINIDSCNNDIFISKNEFERFITKCIGEDQEQRNYLLDEVEIKLPNTFTKEQRLIIHRYSKVNELYSQSFYNNVGARQITLSLSRNYVKKLLAQYNHETPKIHKTIETCEVNQVDESIETCEVNQLDETLETSESINSNNIPENIEKINNKTYTINVSDKSIVWFIYGVIYGVICGVICGVYIK